MNINDIIEENLKLKEEIIFLKNELSKCNAIVDAAIFLRNSGYDGPFIGEIVRPLFVAISRYEEKYQENCYTKLPQDVLDAMEEVKKLVGK